MKDNLQIDLDNYSASAKIKGIPQIIYTNHPQNVESDDYMKEQFKIWGIKNYQKHSKKYSEDTYDDWKHFVLDDDLIQSPKELALTLNVIDSVIEWYDKNESEVCIFMDDDVDLSPINNWLFDWAFLEHHLPYNWDCIQLFCSKDKWIKMHLHPWESNNASCKCFMVTRYFAKRLKHYHYIDGKYKLHYSTPNRSIPFFEYGSLHRFFYDIGITYTLPIFALNSDLESETDTNGVLDRISSEAIKYWWINKSKSFSNFEFFHYNKGDEEWKMEVLFNSNSKKPEVYMDQIEGVMLWI